MEIKRNEVAEPQWDEGDYATIIKADVFSRERWLRTVKWEIILTQVEKTRQASQMIDISMYPSTVFFGAIDLLEANLYMTDDIFYYLTGLRLTEAKAMSQDMLIALGFWNMDCYKVLEQIFEGLIQTRNIVVECLKHESIWDITLKVLEKNNLAGPLVGSQPVPTYFSKEKCANFYARDHYAAAHTDLETRATQIANILELLNNFYLIFHAIYFRHIRFTKLLAMFRQSEIAQSDFIEPWRHDFGGTRDSLIAKMEKDTKLGPWVNKYDHLLKHRNVCMQLFFDARHPLAGPIDKEACYNTDNWLSILTVAAVLQEYDEQHQADSEADEDDVLLKLSLYFKDDASTQRFLKSAKAMKDTEIITLVKKNSEAGLCTDTSKALWQVLHDAGIYKAGYKNWNGLMNKR